VQLTTSIVAALLKKSSFTFVVKLHLEIRVARLDLDFREEIVGSANLEVAFQNFRREKLRRHLVGLFVALVDVQLELEVRILAADGHDESLDDDALAHVAAVRRELEVERSKEQIDALLTLGFSQYLLI